MAFIDLFKRENAKRTIYGVVKSDAHKLLIITFLLNRVQTTSCRHKLMALYEKYNVGAKDFTYIGTQL
jgi:hypothetical protein